MAIKFLNKKDIVYVQLKGRLELNKKYLKQDLKICFEDKKTKTWYLVDHDNVLKWLMKFKTVNKTSSWNDHGIYSFPKLPKYLVKELKNYKLYEVLPYFRPIYNVDFGLHYAFLHNYFCNLAEVNESSAKPADGILTPPVCGKPWIVVCNGFHNLTLYL